jgi:hypothetical protein
MKSGGFKKKGIFPENPLPRPNPGIRKPWCKAGKTPDSKEIFSKDTIHFMGNVPIQPLKIFYFCDDIFELIV